MKRWTKEKGDREEVESGMGDTFVDVHVLCDGCTCSGAEPRDNVDDSRREARLRSNITPW